MYTTQKGFTLIELIVVVVLLGILGVTALGKYIDLSSDAQEAANEGVASELSSAASINYAARTLDGTAGINLGADGLDCADLIDGTATSLLQQDISADYTSTGTGNCATNGAGSTFTCTIDETPDIGAASATAVILCTTS